MIMNIFEEDKLYIANTYKRYDVCFVSGKGSKLTDNNGKSYIDFGSGIAVNSFGLSNPVWEKAVKNQISALSHVSNLYYSEPAVELAKLLTAKADMKKVFLSNSGAEANECAIKAARKYSYDKYGINRNEIITLYDSFHGRTMAALSATGQDNYHKFFNPFLDGFKYVAANMKSMISELSEHTCAVMIELVQGEGGVNVLDKNFVKQLELICNEKDIVLIVDEVQTGNGRTGSMYCYQQYGIAPDIVTTAKGLGGGLPIGATMFGEKTENTLSYGTHGSTFGANPICTAGAVAIVNMIDDKLLRNVSKKGKYIKKKLLGFDGIKSVSGMGLMIGAETVKPAGDVVQLALKKGLLVLTAKDKLRLLPALNIPLSVIDEGLQILKEVLI